MAAKDTPNALSQDSQRELAQQLTGVSVYVYSTLSTDMNYGAWVGGNDGNGIPTMPIPIIIKGGAGVADKRFETPRGVVTSIDMALLEQLEANIVFQQHVKNGFVKVQETLEDGDQVAATMNRNDPSAPLVPQDYVELADNVAKPQGTKK